MKTKKQIAKEFNNLNSGILKLVEEFEKNTGVEVKEIIIEQKKSGNISINMKYYGEV